MFVYMILSLCVSAALFLLIWTLRGRMLSPIVLGENMRLEIILTVCGDAPELENAVNCLLWLKKNGTLSGDIILQDKGMDGETLKIAEAFFKNEELSIIY